MIMDSNLLISNFKKLILKSLRSDDVNEVNIELTDEQLEELEFFIGCMSPDALKYFCNHLELKYSESLHMAFTKTFYGLHRRALENKIYKF